MKAILAKKIGMTNIFENDRNIPVTLLEVQPNTVLYIKGQDDKKAIVQLGLGQKKPNKPMAGHLKKSNSTPHYIKEATFTANLPLKIGQKIDVGIFQEGERIKVRGITKGKGFAGTIKRHGFHRGPQTHGSEQQRRPGSIGSAFPQKVVKGKKMAGRLGGKIQTVKNLTIVKIDKENNIMAVKGAIPGVKDAPIMIKGI